MNKANVYIPDELMKELRKRSAESNVPVSQIVADAVQHRLEEDVLDIAAYEARMNEPSISVAEARKQLKSSGRI